MKKRVLVSFNGKCFMACKFCFADELVNDMENGIDPIVESIADRTFDIIYVSHFKENFIDANEGIELCQRLWERYHKDLLIISRCVLDADESDEIADLANAMQKEGRVLYWAGSVVCANSYGIVEDSQKISTPADRIAFLGEMSKKGIPTFLCIRPIFPKEIIPLEDIYEIIIQAQNNVDAVITGPLIISEEIVKRMDVEVTGFKYMDNTTDYLSGMDANGFRYVDVRDEAEHVKEYCLAHNVRVFDHTLQAVDYLENIR